MNARVSYSFQRLPYGACPARSRGNPKISLWLSVDPLAGVNPDKTPYNYTSNNPVVRIDPTGMVDNPIYGTDGTFLGTDDKGLQGEMIVMNKEDFKQGMSHEEAMKLNKGIDGFLNPDIANQALEHYSKLPDRPDFDGMLTLEEANKWYREGNGQPLYVDASKIDISPISTMDIKKGESLYINFESPINFNIQVGLVYGTIKITRIDDKGSVLLGAPNGYLDNYGFEFQQGRTFRNFLTWIGKNIAGKGQPFNIYTYGYSKLKRPPRFNYEFPIGPKD